MDNYTRNSGKAPKITTVPTILKALIIHRRLQRITTLCLGKAIVVLGLFELSSSSKDICHIKILFIVLLQWRRVDLRSRRWIPKRIISVLVHMLKRKDQSEKDNRIVEDSSLSLSFLSELFSELIFQEEIMFTICNYRYLSAHWTIEFASIFVLKKFDLNRFAVWSTLKGNSLYHPNENNLNLWSIWIRKIDYYREWGYGVSGSPLNPHPTLTPPSP